MEPAWRCGGDSGGMWSSLAPQVLQGAGMKAGSGGVCRAAAIAPRGTHKAKKEQRKGGEEARTSQ